MINTLKKFFQGEKFKFFKTKYMYVLQGAKLHNLWCLKCEKKTNFLQGAELHLKNCWTVNEHQVVTQLSCFHCHKQIQTEYEDLWVEEPRGKKCKLNEARMLQF